MKYYVFLLAALTLMIIALPASVRADGENHDCCDMGQDCDMADDCPYMVDGECTMEGECPHECDEMDMEGMHPGMMGPMPGMMGMHPMPHEHPWHAGMPGNFWRHMNDGSLNREAMRYMNEIRTVMILPFGDNTNVTNAGEPILTEAGGPARIVDNLAAVLMDHGYLVIPPRDAEAAYSQFIKPVGHRLHEDEDTLTAGQENNKFYFDQMPDRAMEFYESQVPGLRDQEAVTSGQAGVALTREDIVMFAEQFGADAVFRGWVNEYAVTDDVDADLRTFVPPFLGLINPDRRVTMEVVYYLYDGHSGDLIWNDTVSIQRDSEWPIFNSEEELVLDAEFDVIHAAMNHILPDWRRMVRHHPEWVPFEMWEGCDMGDMGMMMNRPDWINPHRMGWHDEYIHRDWTMDLGEPKGESERERDFTHAYNALREYMD